jgi:hypothetical protein
MHNLFRNVTLRKERHFKFYVNANKNQYLLLGALWRIVSKIVMAERKKRTFENAMSFLYML